MLLVLVQDRQDGPEQQIQVAQTCRRMKLSEIVRGRGRGKGGEGKQVFCLVVSVEGFFLLRWHLSLSVHLFFFEESLSVINVLSVETKKRERERENSFLCVQDALQSLSNFF